MSSGALGGASHRMPNHANGYSRKYPPVDDPVTARAHDAARAVGADDELGLDHERRAVGVDRDDPGPRGLGILHPLGGDAEPQVLPAGESRGDEVLQHLVLRVEPDAAADERGEVDAVTLAREAQLDAVVAMPDGADAG